MQVGLFTPTVKIFLDYSPKTTHLTLITLYVCMYVFEVSRLAD